MEASSTENTVRPHGISRASGPAPRSSRAGSAASAPPPSSHGGAVGGPTVRAARHTLVHPSNNTRSSRYGLGREGALRLPPGAPAAHSAHTPPRAPVPPRRTTRPRGPAPRAYAGDAETLA